MATKFVCLLQLRNTKLIWSPQLHDYLMIHGKKIKYELYIFYWPPQGNRVVYVKGVLNTTITIGDKQG